MLYKRHSRASGNLYNNLFWMPAFAGMTAHLNSCNKMIKQISLTIIIAILVQLSPLAHARNLTDNETWSGKIKLIEDIYVPEGRTLTIAPDSQVITNGNKIISYGTVNIQGQQDKKVKLLANPPLSPQDLAVLKIKPYDINTEILKEEFNAFKIQYAILWSVLFAGMFIMVEAR